MALQTCQNSGMQKILKWLVGLALTLVVVFAALVFALHRWVSTDDFRQRVVQQASAALGVPVTLGSISVDVWPVPAVALSSLQVQSSPAITVGRIEARPLWQPLLQGRLVVATLIVRQAVLPQLGLDSVLQAMQALSKKKLLAPVSIGPGPDLKAKNGIARVSDAPLAASSSSPASEPAAMAWLPRRTLLDDVTWVSAAGTATALDGQALLGDDGLPDSASVKLIRGNLQGLRAELKRQSPDEKTDVHAWALRIDVGGGSVTGPVKVQVPSADTGRNWRVTAQLKTQGVELTALTAPGKTLSGLLDATSTLDARAATTAALAEALQTGTTFTVRHAVLHGIDLAKAVKTVGLSRGGETRLDTLTGQINTQGRAAQLSKLVASSGALSASGQVDISSAKALSGRIHVDLADSSKLGKALGGAVGVPLAVGGTVAAPEVTLERSALIGGLLGSVLAPGVGTGAGLKLGGSVSEGLKGLFGKK